VCVCVVPVRERVMRYVRFTVCVCPYLPVICLCVSVPASMLQYIRHTLCVSVPAGMFRYARYSLCVPVPGSIFLYDK